MPEIKMKGSIPVFSSRRSSCTTNTTLHPPTPEHNQTPHSNIPSFHAGIAKPRQRSLPRAAALSANNCNNDKSALLNKYITPPSTQVNEKYNNQNNNNQNNNNQNNNNQNNNNQNNNNNNPTINNNSHNHNNNHSNKNNNNSNNHNNSNTNRSTNRTINYNCNSLNRRKVTSNDKNNNVIIVDKNKTHNQLFIESENTLNNNNNSNNNNNNSTSNNGNGLVDKTKVSSKSPSTKSKLIRPSTSVGKQKKEVDSNNNISDGANNHSNMLYIKNNININKSTNNIFENNNKNNNLNKINKNNNNNTMCVINNSSANTESNEGRISHQFQAAPRSPFKDNSDIATTHKNNKNNNISNYNNNNKTNNTNNNHITNNKIPSEISKNAINNVLKSEMRNCSSNNSLNSDLSKLKPPRTISSGRPSGLLKSKGTNRGSRQTSPETTNRSLEDVLDSKTRSKISSGKKTFRSTERILSSEKLHDVSQKETANKPLRVNSIGRGSKSGLKYPGRTGNMKKLMSDVENNFKNSTLNNDQHSRISGSSNDSSGNSYEEKASSEYGGNFDSRVRDKGISKSHSKLVVPGFAMKSLEPGKSRLPKYPSKTIIPSAFQQNKQQQNQHLKNNLQYSKPLLKQSIIENQISNSERKLDEKEENTSDGRTSSSEKDSIFENKLSTLDATSPPHNKSLDKEQFAVNGTDISHIIVNNNIASTNIQPYSTGMSANSTVTTATATFTTPSINTKNDIVSAYDIQPMAPISMSAPYFHLNSPISTNNNNNPHNFSPFYAKNITLNPNKLAGINEFYKLKSSFHRLNITSLDPSNADENNSEAGYMSDGDLLSCKGHQRSSGYVSDGGNSLLSLDKHKRNSNNPSVDEDADVKTSFKRGRCYADTNSSIYEENFDVLSSLSSNEDGQNNNTTSQLTSSNSELQSTTDDAKDGARKEFERNHKARSTMPVKGKRAILPLCGFVKKTHENDGKGSASGDDAEIDVEVLFENKVSTMKRNLPGMQGVPSAINPPQNSCMINEGMVDLDHLIPEYTGVNEHSVSSLPPPHPSYPTHHVSSAPNFLDTPKKTSASSLKSIPHSYSLLPNYSLSEFKSFPTSSTISSLAGGTTGGWNREGGTGSKFGMSLEQCYNSGVFQRRNSSNSTSSNPSSNFLTLSDISQNDKMPNVNTNSPLNTYGNNHSNSNFNNDIIRNNTGNNHNHNEKTLSVASDGDQGSIFAKMSTPLKSIPYATMSRSQMAMRMARRLEMNKADTDSKGYIRSCYATPITNRKSDISMYYPDDSSSIASFPFSKNRHSKTPMAFHPHNQSPFNLDESCYSAVAGSSYAGSVISGDSSNYMLNRSGSYKIRNSRPPSTNENGSTLSLGSCSSLYSTAEEHHAQEIRKLRHELETAHSRVSSLNMQLNINENVVQAFEQSISNLNQRLHHLTQTTSANGKEADYTDMKSCFEQIEPFKTSNTPDDCSSGASLIKQQELERKKKQKKWLMSFGKSFFKKKSKLNNYENEITVEINHHAEDNNNKINNNNNNNDNNTNKNSKNSNTIITNGVTESDSLKCDKSLSTKKSNHDPASDPVEALEKRLHEREMKLTDVQLEALSSAHQLDQLKGNMAQMEKEMVYLKMDNSRLKQQLVGKSKESSLNGDDDDDNDNEVTSSTPADFIDDVKTRESPDAENGSGKHKRIVLSVQFKHTSHHNSLAFSEVKSKEILFGKMYLTEIMGWETLNRTVARKFENYLARVDPEEHLGLSEKSIRSIRVGEQSWSLDGTSPPMSPTCYFIAFNNSLSITLKGVNEKCLDALAFETMISKMILERYVGLLMDFKRVIFCGPSGTGKTYLALKLAQYMYDRLAKERKDPSLSVFNVDHKSSKELRQYLSNMTRNCINNTNNNNDDDNNNNNDVNCDKSLADNVDNEDSVAQEIKQNDKNLDTNKTSSPTLNNTNNTSNPTSNTKTSNNTNNNMVITNISNRDHLPHNNIIVLDNLHHVVSLADVFNGFVSIGNHSSPYVIGTMNQVSTSNTTNLQLHHMFRWVLYSNHIRPVSGFLGRFLRRHMVEREVLGDGDFKPPPTQQDSAFADDDETTMEKRASCGEEEEELRGTIEWMPKVWQHVNKLLEAHNSSEVTLGPQLYLSCPMGGKLMKVWFTDLWNYSIFPYIVEAVKEGIQTYGCRSAWEDPTVWLEKTCPWQQQPQQPDNCLQLLHLRPEDVGYDLQQHQQHKQQQQQQLQLKQQHFQQQSPHYNGTFNNTPSELNNLAFQTTTNNNIDNNNFDNNNNTDHDYLYQSQHSNPDTLMNMLLKLKGARNQQ